MGTRCTCGQGHKTFGACIRAKGLRIGWAASARGLDATEERNKERELELYRSARDQGIQPGSTRALSTRYALDISDELGKPFKADDFSSIRTD